MPTCPRNPRCPPCFFASWQKEDDDDNIEVGDALFGSSWDVISVEEDVVMFGRASTFLLDVEPNEDEVLSPLISLSSYDVQTAYSQHLDRTKHSTCVKYCLSSGAVNGKQDGGVATCSKE